MPFAITARQSGELEIGNWSLRNVVLGGCGY